MRSAVYQGSAWSRLAKMLVTFGTTTTIITRDEHDADDHHEDRVRERGADLAAELAPALSMKSARRSSTASSVPEASPAATMFT